MVASTPVCRFWATSLRETKRKTAALFWWIPPTPPPPRNQLRFTARLHVLRLVPHRVRLEAQQRLQPAAHVLHGAAPPDLFRSRLTSDPVGWPRKSSLFDTKNGAKRELSPETQGVRNTKQDHKLSEVDSSRCLWTAIPARQSTSLLSGASLEKLPGEIDFRPDGFQPVKRGKTQRFQQKNSSVRPRGLNGFLHHKFLNPATARPLKRLTLQTNKQKTLAPPGRAKGAGPPQRSAHLQLPRDR